MIEKHGSNKDTKNHNFEEIQELIKLKLKNDILNYDAVSASNYNFGLAETLESIYNSIDALFDDPEAFEIIRDCDDCKYFETLDPYREEGTCRLHEKYIKPVYGDACNDFKWRI